MNLKPLMSCKWLCFLSRTRARKKKRSRRVTAGVARRWQDDSPPRAGFSQSRRASPEAHQSRLNLPVSKCGFLLAFDKQTASSEPDTILRMKISKDVYVRYRSQQEHLWTPEAESSPRVMHWPWRMSERGDFPPVAGQYFINSVWVGGETRSRLPGDHLRQKRFCEWSLPSDRGVGTPLTSQHFGESDSSWSGLSPKTVATIPASFAITPRFP